MATAAVQSRTMITENELVQQGISEHLAKIAASTERIAVSMEKLAVVEGINHRQVREQPPSYDVATNTVIGPRRPRLQNPVHDYIEAIERDLRTLQIAFAIAIIGIAICYTYSEAGGIPLPVLLGMLLVLAAGFAVSRRN